MKTEARLGLSPMGDLEFVLRLMEENCKSLGPISIRAVRKAHDNNRILIHVVDGERVGYLLFGPLRRGQVATVWQI